MPVDLRERGANVFDLAVEAPVVEKWPIFCPEDMFGQKDIEQIAGEINSVAKNVIEAHNYYLFYSILFPDSINLLDNSPDVGKYYANICAHARPSDFFPRQAIILKILFPELFSEFKSSIADSAFSLWDRLTQNSLDNSRIGDADIYKLLFPERFKNNIKLPKPDKLIEKIQNEDEMHSKILWLAQIRILYPDVKPQALVGRDYLEKKCQELVRYKKYYAQLRGCLDYAFALALLTAEKVEVDESGLKITMPQMQTSITERTILPEERSF